MLQVILIMRIGRGYILFIGSRAESHVGRHDSILPLEAVQGKVVIAANYDHLLTSKIKDESSDLLSVRLYHRLASAV
jgi:hypothetical protein